MTPAETKWTARVQSWRESEKTAEEFSAGQGYQPSTLKYWASRLKSSATRAAAPVPIARVVRQRSRSVNEASIEVLVGRARVLVRRGFDAALLREIAAALGGER